MREAARWLSISSSHSTSHSTILWEDRNNSMTKTTWERKANNQTRLVRDSTSPDNSSTARRDLEALVNVIELSEEDSHRNVVPAAKCENIEVRAVLICTG